MLVGVLGLIGSGKGTVGEILQEVGFHQLSFASGLKDVTANMFNWPRNLLEGDTDESRLFRETPDKFWSKRMGKDFTPRLALQLMGTEVGRNIFHPDFWVIKVENEIKTKKGNRVITDVRFENEIECIKKMGGVLIEIKRGIPPHWYTIAEQANKGFSKAEKHMRSEGIHESEWKWIGCGVDHVIHNNSTKENLKNEVFSCLKKSFGNSIIDELIEGAS
jgi:hypothetical protein